MSCPHGKLDGCAACEEIAQIRSALRLARMALDQGQTLKGRIAANGPTIGEVIDAALAAQEQT